MKPAVVFDRVWKQFRRGERHDSLRDLVPSIARRIAGRRPTQTDARDFWALQDVTFDVAPGEAFGIIGPNGAGKSTTLKLLTRILKPTRGSCSIRGRVGALIEVAAGFHPDLTGRENIFLQGAIMGMKQADIARRLDAIIDFAGVSSFIDTPVKRYSSGMNARLGFAIAAHLDPDVLVIDEVLSVGDMAFQERCVNRMIEFKRQGTSIVFVSHNLQAVTTLCDRAIYIQNQTIECGAAQRVVSSYVGKAMVRRDQSDSTFILKHSALESSQGTEAVSPGTVMTLRLAYEGRREVSDVTLSFIVYRSTDRLEIYNANLTADEVGLRHVTAGTEFTVALQFAAHLTRGAYHVECVIVHNPTQTFLSSQTAVGSFSVDESRTWVGIADVNVAVIAHASTSQAPAFVGTSAS